MFVTKAAVVVTAPTTTAFASKLVLLSSFSGIAHPPRLMQLSLPRPFKWRESSLSSSSEMTANESQMTKDALRMASAAIRAVCPDVAIRDRLHMDCSEDWCELIARADDTLLGVPWYLYRYLPTYFNPA